MHTQLHTPEFNSLLNTDLYSNNAHFVLLGNNYTLKINLSTIDASHFDESYAPPGHIRKISWFFTQRRWKQS